MYTGGNTTAVAGEQLCGQVVSPGNERTRNIGRDVFCAACVGVIKWGLIVQLLTSRMEAGSNNSTVAQRVAGGDEKGTQCLGV
jgi:hypothetical protein